MDKKSIEGLSFNFNITINKHKYHVINDIIGEMWKPVHKFENIYYVSNKGRVKNVITNKLMSLFTVGDYLKVSLKSKPYFVHKLVATAFIPNPYNKHYVDHIDTNPLNNNVENLRWVINTKRNNKILKPCLDNRGYLKVTLRVDYKRKDCFIHKLVSKYFVSNPNNYNITDHIDGNVLNNYYKIIIH